MPAFKAKHGIDHQLRQIQRRDDRRAEREFVAAELKRQEAEAAERAKPKPATAKDLRKHFRG